MNNITNISSEKFNSEDLLSEFDKLNKNLKNMSSLISRGRNITNEKVINISQGLKINSSTQEIEFQVKNLQIELDHLKLMLPKNIESLDVPEEKTLSQLSEARKKAPVTTQAIKLQAELHQAIREGKAWALKQLFLTPLVKNTHNQVYVLGNAAFFKMGSENDVAVATMEKLIWDIAVVMGCEDQFVPTEEAEIKFSGPVVWKGVRWNRPATKVLHKGSIQPAQKGKLLIPYIKEGGTFQISEVINAVCASLVFGMFDAHFNNIFVTDEGKIKFFDNTRSFPNSNGLINRGNSMVSSYRCCLLDLYKPHGELTLEQIDKLKKNVQVYKEKLVPLYKYLKSREVQIRLEKLPPGWMDLEAAFGAMKERIELMEKALEDGNVKTLEDLAAQANPNYKFIYALDYLYRGKKQSTLDVKLVHEAIGCKGSSEILTKLKNKYPEINIKKIKNWCDDSTLCFEAVKNKVRDHLSNTAQKTICKKKFMQRQKEYEEIRNLLITNVRYDFKDWSRKSCNAYFLSKIFNEMNMPIYEEKKIQDYIKDPNVIKAGIQKKDGNLELIYRISNQIFIKPILLSSNPEKVKINNEQIDVKEYIESQVLGKR